MLHVIPLSQARELSASLAKTVTRTETVPLDRLAGRVTAADVVCRENVPAFCRSTMDGYAVAAADTFGAGEAAPVDLTVVGEAHMGEETTLRLPAGACLKIPTGGMLPAGADAVVPVEYTDLDFDTCLVYSAVSPKENVTYAGDDIRAGSLLFAARTRLTPAAAGALAAAGIEACAVYCPPKVGIISTGNELVGPGRSLPPGKVRDVNAPLLAAMCRGYGCEPLLYGIVPDEESALTGTLRKAAAENDLVLLSGGSSAGEKDLTAKIIGSLGVVLAHGIAMKPGKPTVIGKIGETPVFGLPGHPAACCFVTETVVKPCIETLSGAALPVRQIKAALTENISSNHGREEFVCVRLHNGEATPLYAKSGVISLLSAADGYLQIPRDCEGLRAGTQLTIHLF